MNNPSPENAQFEPIGREWLVWGNKTNASGAREHEPGVYLCLQTAKAVRQYFFFEIGVHKYSLPFHVVDEILPAVELLPVPGSHYAMEGLLDVRGEIIPVVALRTLLNLEPRSISYTDHLIIPQSQF